MDTPNLLHDLGLFAVSILFSGLYSASEAALVSCSIDRTKQLIQLGGPKAKALEFLAEHANELLTTILVGNNLVNIFAASLATEVAQKVFQDDALAISVGFSTFFILLFGEIVPKTFARSRGERYIVLAIRALQVNYYLFYPIIIFFMLIIKAVLGKNAELSGNIVTKSDIEFMINKAEKEKTMDSKQLDLLSSILEFPKIKVKDIMVPRQKIIYIDKDIKYDELMEIIVDKNHSRYPVCVQDLEHVIGFLHVKDLVGRYYKDRSKFKLDELIKTPFFIYEHMKIQAVFDHMNRKKVHMAIIKDENGIIVGIVTLEDIMEEIFGEINDEHDLVEGTNNQHSTKLGDQGVLVEGDLSLRDLYTVYKVKIPLNDNYSTLAGFLLDKLGNNFPKEGMIVFLEGYSFLLEKVEEQEIKKVRVCDVDGEKHLFPHDGDFQDPTLNKQ